MNFENREERENHFDTLIDLFQDGDIEGFEIEFARLQSYNMKNFLMYLYRNKESIPEKNNIVMFRLCLDYL